MEKDLKNTVESNDVEIGTVQIADEVVADIVSIAAAEVDGVAEVSPNKGLSKGVGCKDIFHLIQEIGLLSVLKDIEFLLEGLKILKMTLLPMSRRRVQLFLQK